MGRVLAAKNEVAMGETSKQETEKEEQKGRKRKAPVNKEATGEVEKETKVKRPARGAAAKQDSAAAKQNGDVDAEMPEAKPKRPVRGSAAKESVVVEKAEQGQEEDVEQEVPKARRQARGAAAAVKQKKVDVSKQADAVGEKEGLADGEEQGDGEKAEQQTVETPKRRGRPAKAVNAKKEDVKKEMDQVPAVSMDGGDTVVKDQEETLSKDEDAQNAENAVAVDETAVQKQQPTLDVSKKRGRTAKAQMEEVKKEAVEAAVMEKEEQMTDEQKESEAKDEENALAAVPAEHDQDQKPTITEKAKQKEDDDKEQEKKQPGRKRKVVQLLKEEPMEDEDVAGEQEVPEKETVKRSRDSKIKKEEAEMQEDEETKKKTRGKKAVAVEKVEEDREKTTEEDGKEEESAEKEAKLDEAPKVKGRGRKKEKVEVTEESKEESAPVAESSAGRRRGKQETVKTAEKEVEEVNEEKEEEEVGAKVTQKKKKEIVAVESDAQKLLRTTIGAEVIKAAGNSEKYLGVHVSAAGSLEQAIYNARAIGCRSFAFFTRSSRTWKLAPMEDEVVKRWNQVIQETSYPLDKILPHGSYLMNPASPKEEILVKSRECLLHECQRAEKLGIKHYNFHPGSTVGECTVEEACRTVSESINYVHKNTNDVILVIETMARQGHTVGGSFTELALMIDGVDDKKRVGVCIDTCHVFAAGYEFNTTAGYDAMMKEFEEKIGFQYLKGFHVNDSKDKCGMRKDRHELIGKGNIKVDGFRRMMNDDRLNGIPMILETPDTGDNYPKEMILLHSLEESPEEEDSKTKNAKKVTMAADVDQTEEEELKQEEVEVPTKKKRGAVGGPKRKGKK